jgi:Uma2 family endonuclease
MFRKTPDCAVLANFASLDNSCVVQATQKAALVRVEDYLEGELHSQSRHEYVGGVVYAMAGASDVHNTISLNLASSLRTHLRTRSCQVFMADVKLRMRVREDELFYYPDVMVTCDPRNIDRYFKSYPSVLIEVLSPETERTDRREKFLSYTQIETLEAYILVAQDKMQATVFRRTNRWQPEILERADEKLTLDALGFSMPLADVYEGIEL